VAVEAASDAATETTEAELRARIQELTKETEMLVKGMDVFSDHCAKLTEANAGHLARIAQLEHEARVMREELGESREVERQAVDSRDRRIAQLEEALRDMAELGREMAGKARVDDTTSVANHLLINHLLESCGLTLPNQEPQS
jgi:predicted RNase H-like nuclease (RuvC/YqgF family)